MSANHHWSVDAAAMEGDSQAPANMSTTSNSDDENRAAQLWDPKWAGSQEPSSHKASHGESGSCSEAVVALVSSAMPGVDGLKAMQTQTETDHGLQLAVVANSDSGQTGTATGVTTGDWVVPS